VLDEAGADVTPRLADVRGRPVARTDLTGAGPPARVAAGAGVSNETTRSRMREATCCEAVDALPADPRSPVDRDDT